MPLRLLLLFALPAVILIAKEQKQVPNCCEPQSEKLPQSRVKALVKQTEPIHAPCCADMLHISGTVALAISVDPQGNVACVRTVSGHPLVGSGNSGTSIPEILARSAPAGKTSCRLR
jgi:hypothetical protein